MSPAWPGWIPALLLLLPPPSTRALPERIVYSKLGGVVSLTPGINATAIITGVTWKEGHNLAMNWDGTELDAYRHFKERGHLNTTSGVMTIRGLLGNDSNVYTPEINKKVGTPIRLTVLPAVPVPTVTKSCDENLSSCELTCSADTTGAGPVTYKWKFDDQEEPDSSRKSVVTKVAAGSVKEFSCELENPVSRESSQPIPSPFITPSEGLKISNGLIVFICLLGVVALVVVVHRLKAGVWFFEKGSMPWEADFWMKYESAPRDAAEANGTSAAAQQRPAEEETGLT